MAHYYYKCLDRRKKEKKGGKVWVNKYFASEVIRIFKDIKEQFDLILVSTNMTSNQPLTKPKFIKIKDLQTQRSGYNVYAKVISTEHRVVETHEGLKVPMVECIIADETASAKAFFKGEHANLIQKGNVIAIRNGVKKFIKDHISLEIDLFGRVTLEKDLTINATEALNISDAEHKLERRDNRRPRPQGNRRDQGERRDRGNREFRGERRERGNREERPDRRNREERGERREGGNREERPDRRERGNREERGERRPQREGAGRQEGRQENRYNRTNNRQEQRGERRREAPRRQNDRDYDRRGRGEGQREYRPRREYAEKREENRGDRKPMTWSRLADIMPAEDHLNLNVKILSLETVGTRNIKYRCVIGDSTAIANAFLPNKIDLKEGDSIVLFNAKAEVVKEHIEIQLDFNGRIELSRRPVDKVSEEFNLSSKAWVPIE